MPWTRDSSCRPHWQDKGRDRSEGVCVNEKALYMFGWFPINPLMLLANVVAPSLVHLHTRRTAASLGSVWKRPRNQISEPRRLRAYSLYHPISHADLMSRLCSLPSPIVILSPSFPVRYRYLMRHSPTTANATAIAPIACSTLLFSLTLFLSWMTYLIYVTILVTLPGACSTITCK
jgi:hypothetical protein